MGTNLTSATPTTNWDSEAERQFWASQCQKSFWDFCNYCLQLNRFSWFTADIHKPLCDWFELHVRDWLQNRSKGLNSQKYLMVLIPRRAGKTTVITQAGLLWLHLQDPDLSTYIGSEKEELASVILQPLKTTLSGEDPFSRWVWLYGNWYTKNRQWKTNLAIHAARHNMSKKEPSFGTWGVESGLTGKHPDVLCLDDPTTYEKIASHSNWLETVNNHIASLFPVMQSNGLFIAVGTRYSDGDHFGKAIRVDGIKTWTGHTKSNIKIDPLGLWDSFYMAGRKADNTPALPEIWSEEQMRHYEANDPLKYAAQVLNDPSASKYNPLTRDQVLKCVITPNEIPKDLRVFFHADTAFKTQATQGRGDHTTLVINGHTYDGTGRVYVLEVQGSNWWRAEDFLKLLVEKVGEYKRKGYKIGAITDDKQVGGHEGSWALNIQNAFTDSKVYPPAFIPLSRQNRTKKEVRHVHAAAHVVDGRVFFANNCPNLERLLEQLTHIGANFQDDYIDAFSDSFVPEIYVAQGLNSETPEVRPKSIQESILSPTISPDALIKYYDIVFKPDDYIRPIEDF